MTHGLKAFALVVLLFGSFAANAVRIVNTGPGPEADGGYIVSTYQSLAGEFSTKRAFEITEIEGWMVPGNNDLGSRSFRARLECEPWPAQQKPATARMMPKTALQATRRRDGTH